MFAHDAARFLNVVAFKKHRDAVASQGSYNCDPGGLCCCVPSDALFHHRANVLPFCSQINVAAAPDDTYNISVVAGVAPSLLDRAMFLKTR